MSEFKSWHSFRTFENATKHRTRYVHDSEVEAFLDTVLQTTEKRVEVVAQENILWRAQLGCGQEPFYQKGKYIDDIPAPHPSDRMKPLKGRANEGRANPKGIPYLYLATNRNTALAEVRPWMDSFISVGQFKTLRELRLVHCTTDQRHFVYLKEPSAEKREESVWAAIDRAFARPINPSDDIADYVPTQIIAELFKANNFDGIAYRSSLGGGHNVALFDLDVAELVSCYLFQATSISFEFKESATPYHIHKH